MQPRYNDVLERETPSNKPRTTAPKAPSKPRDKANEKSEKPVALAFKQPNARNVCVAGSFNNWNQKLTPLQKDGDGWKVTLPLRPGRYEYRFIVDGEWISDPNARESVTNDFGSTNSILVV